MWPDQGAGRFHAPFGADPPTDVHALTVHSNGPFALPPMPQVTLAASQGPAPRACRVGGRPDQGRFGLELLRRGIRARVSSRRRTPPGIRQAHPHHPRAWRTTSRIRRHRLRDLGHYEGTSAQNDPNSLQKVAFLYLPPIYEIFPFSPIGFVGCDEVLVEGALPLKCRLSTKRARGVKPWRSP